MPGINRLAATKVKRLNKPGRYADGAGLYLQIARAGTKSWLFQYTFNGRERQLGLGSLKTTSLADARVKAKKARTIVDDGVDPIAAKREAREQAQFEEARRITFEEAATDYIAAKSPEWKNAKHKLQWTASLRNYAYPMIGSKSVADINKDHVLQILRPIWSEMPETAGRLRGRIERILGAAKAAGHRTGDNPARWADHLEHSLPALGKIRNVAHHAAMPYSELAAFVAKLQKREGLSARALELLILTASRTGELIGIRDDEVDFKDRVWTIPSSRMKAGREHLVPLCDRAIAILRAVPRERGNPYFFAGSMKKGTHLSNMAMLSLMKHIAADYTPHGFRSTFSDWAHETTSTAHHVVEMALAHTIENKTEAAYRRGTLFEKRRRLMKAWETFLYSRKVKS